MFYDLLRPLLFKMDAERAHDAMLRAASLTPSWIASLWAPDEYSELKQNILGREYLHPLGLAAGVDKDAQAVDFWANIGFSFVELGTVTPGHGQLGNEKPRMWRLSDQEAIINRLGFNNRGADAIAERLERHQTFIPFGVSIGKSSTTPLDIAHYDYADCASTVAQRVAPEYFAINVSSPNTKDLRRLQRTEDLARIIGAVRKEAPIITIAVKLSPDLDAIELVDIAQLCVDLEVGFIIAVNTTTHRPMPLTREEANLQGGLSGPALRGPAERVTRQLYRTVRGRVPIIGVGGISTPADAYERLCAGASLLQLYTALVYQGPGVVRRIVDGLAALLDGRHVSSIIGSEA